MTTPREAISIRAACALAHVSRRTIYNWITANKVGYVRTAGGRIRIFVDTLFAPGNVPVSSQRETS